MTRSETFIFRAALDRRPSIYRDIEIETSKSLYRLAEAINIAFEFDFDHAFGFYSGFNDAAMRRHPRYELFADMGEADPGTHGVKRTRISDAFRKVGHTLAFLFDYGDEWHFRVTLKAVGTKLPKTRYPRVIARKGEAPEQYPESDDLDELDRPRIGINLATGEKIKIG